MRKQQTTEQKELNLPHLSRRGFNLIIRHWGRLVVCLIGIVKCLDNLITPRSRIILFGSLFQTLPHLLLRLNTALVWFAFLLVDDHGAFCLQFEKRALALFSRSSRAFAALRAFGIGVATLFGLLLGLLGGFLSVIGWSRGRVFSVAGISGVLIEPKHFHPKEMFDQVNILITLINIFILDRIPRLVVSLPCAKVPIGMSSLIGALFTVREPQSLQIK